MWRAILESQWRWSRGLILLGVLLVFAIPLLSIRMAASAETLVTFISTIASWGVGYAVAAGTLGLMTAIAAWSFDHRLRHIYALSLPLPRWRYVAYRYASGVAMLVIPTAALLVSAEIAAHSKLVPATLHAYPLALTLRFAFAMLVAYSLFFAVASATPRTAGYILGLLASIVVAQVLFSSASLNLNLISRALDLVFAAPGLLAVFGGRWMLIDV